MIRDILQSTPKQIKSAKSLSGLKKLMIVNRCSDFLGFFSLADLATKLTQLEKAFKKYEVETEECQMFIACEAAQTKKLAQNVTVVKIVSQILK